MAYIPDWCSYELTPGQMASMMAQVKQEKDYIYCNYADVLDPVKCGNNPPCASTATSPNCVSQPPPPSTMGPTPPPAPCSARGEACSATKDVCCNGCQLKGKNSNTCK
mmetsp:Transcript_36922/g.77420  ORF Transcript_36922/g.77420 Transcript_36922/m.77420 type:complete len:108 (+) Transcript_36922:2-325(+)